MINNNSGSTVPVTLEKIHKNAVEMCSVRRYGHMSAAVTRDIAIGRTVPWTCVQAAWNWLKGPRAVQPRSTNAGLFPMASVDFVEKVQHMVECMQPDWDVPDWPCPGELWIRWGVDGVPRWSIGYVTLTVALCGEHSKFKMHSVERFAHCAVLCGTESVDSITALFNATDFNAALETLEGAEVIVSGRQLKIRSYLLGDHMLQYKATGASGPGSSLPSRQSCPYCDAPPDEALSWRTGPRPLAQAVRGHAPLQAIPRTQCIPDAMHGCHNVLNGVVLAAVRNGLVAKGLPMTEVNRICSIGLQRAEEWAFDDDSNMKRSITQSLAYLNNSGFSQLMTELHNHLAAGPCMAVEAAMQDLKNMVCIVYTKNPTTGDIRRFADCAVDLRARLQYLKAPTTIWGHVWTIHLPQFLALWGTLYPFVCHGVEGKHRVFKADLQLSTGNQWGPTGWGFAQTLVLDRIRWQLFAEGTRDWHRQRVRRDNSHVRAYRLYEAHMQKLV